ncbi:hypothetical protein HMPREF3192_01073 [Atopobium deltae]|uniref:Uncharacterized protein n=1 Tax=Atopobium deltae TaxID=1393034 RepID=A0A133XSC2_9ACTN|nr:hypothetical protein HMPREF3192_01073 [Atopobium deltae]
MRNRKFYRCAKTLASAQSAPKRSCQARASCVKKLLKRDKNLQSGLKIERLGAKKHRTPDI